MMSAAEAAAAAAEDAAATMSDTAPGANAVTRPLVACRIVTAAAAVEEAEGSGLTALVIAPAVAIDISRKSAADRAMQAGVAREEAVNAAVEAASHARESEVIAGCQEAVRRIGEQILADKLAEDIAKRKAEAKARLMKSAKTTLFNATMQKAADDAQAAREREQEIVEFAEVKSAEYLLEAVRSKAGEDVATKAAEAAAREAERQAEGATRQNEDALSSAAAADKNSAAAQQRAAQEVIASATAIKAALKVAKNTKAASLWGIVTEKARALRKAEDTAKNSIGGKRQAAEQDAEDCAKAVKKATRTAKEARKKAHDQSEKAEAAWQALSADVAFIEASSGAATSSAHKVTAAAAVAQAASDVAASMAMAAAAQAAAEADATRLAATGKAAAASERATSAASAAAVAAASAVSAAATAPAEAIEVATAAQAAATATASEASEERVATAMLVADAIKAEAASAAKQAEEAEYESKSAEEKEKQRAQEASARAEAALKAKEAARLKADEAAERASAAVGVVGDGCRICGIASAGAQR